MGRHAVYGGAFLARAGVLFDRPDWIDESKRQFLLHIKYLTDLKTGLFYHGWSFKRLDHFAGALWGRGNAWLTVAIPDYIDILGDRLEWSVKEILLSSLARQIEALEKYQDASGGWHTLVNEPESYLEMSATSGFCYGILKSVRLGYVNNSYLKCGIRALKALCDNIDGDGVVQNVSYGTALKDNLDYYRNIRITPMTYGQALAVLALSEGVKVKCDE
ncbi:MAG: glycoside hydrolase family 88 protein [Clostridia bacterium]|nr:glycoside hydrolase family 88 protein [Clostridia bacterium]